LQQGTVLLWSGDFIPSFTNSVVEP